LFRKCNAQVLSGDWYQREWERMYEMGEGKYGGNIMYSVMKIEKCSNYSKNVCRRDKGE
jgi:hypothetical protein